MKNVHENESLGGEEIGGEGMLSIFCILSIYLTIKEDDIYLKFGNYCGKTDRQTDRQREIYNNFSYLSLQVYNSQNRHQQLHNKTYQ